MACVKRGSIFKLKYAAPQTPYSEEDGYITNLNPEGSSNSIQIIPEMPVINRPDINFVHAVLNVIIPLVIAIGIGFIDMRIALIAIGLYIIIRTRAILIWFVMIYQRYAPDHVRQACVFNPSCSNYMILCIKKYGAVRGCIKGIKRLSRCHRPNGGDDYP